MVLVVLALNLPVPRLGQNCTWASADGGVSPAIATASPITVTMPRDRSQVPTVGVPVLKSPLVLL